MTTNRLEDLALPQMVPENTEYLSTGFAISCDLKEGTTTGISATDRAKTIRALADAAGSRPISTAPATSSRFALRRVSEACRGTPRRGRSGAGFAGAYPAGVLCEIAQPDGEWRACREAGALAGG
ncbi:3,4-dihydroxy-2-butanone-4-phosphate synthase [Neoaquamicrobium sediminum]|uniref:3,4-dihydroxy-2-butanone-4-phosphate synthase n=1 Tax=Neoaquamicrobium sediminum TaxID=1849104 RepID=UPI001FD2BD23|nr:3,4-dihydroxy-2-butanone-4-phosphate synthase [Mesorhizobium sediminum]